MQLYYGSLFTTDFGCSKSLGTLKSNSESSVQGEYYYISQLNTSHVKAMVKARDAEYEMFQYLTKRSLK